MSKQRILICGDVEGRFNSFFTRIEKLNEKSGPFDLVLCVGNFFGINNNEFKPYQTGIKKVPVPTYILGPNKGEHNIYYPQEGSELCHNVNYLGRKGLFLNSGGLRIAYLSGVASEETSGLHTYTFEDVSSLVDLSKRETAKFKGIDILLTSQWPSDVTKYDPNFKVKHAWNQTTHLLAWLAIQLKPRYHICGLEGLFYERPPYRAPTLSEHDVSEDIATRFIGLARVGNANKQKWLYALSLTPIEQMKCSELIQKTTDETACPYNLNEVEMKVLKNKRKVTTSHQYFYDMNNYEEEEKSKQVPKKQKVVINQNNCWFCLASPSIEKHLIISLGETVYLALAKGGLVEEHFLICPIEHHQCITDLAENVLHEIDKYKKALGEFCSQKEEVPIFFERNYRTSHMQIQCIPVPKKDVKILASTFVEEAEKNNFELSKLNRHQSLDDVLQKGSSYFYVEISDDEIYYTVISVSQKFPLDFGRTVLASPSLLNMETRGNWRECVLQKQDEESLVQKIRKDFEPYIK